MQYRDVVQCSLVALFVLDRNGEIMKRLVVTLAHCIELNADICFPVGRHEVIFEFCMKSFEQEDLEFIIMNFNSVFPVGILQSSHHLHGLLLFGNVLVCDVVPAGNLKHLKYFSIKVSRMEDRAFAPFLLTNGDVFL